MCGICGKISLNGEPVEESLIKRMTGCLEHRGPDDEGIYIKGNVGLGHPRLSIIDLSPLVVFTVLTWMIETKVGAFKENRSLSGFVNCVSQKINSDSGEGQ